MRKLRAIGTLMVGVLTLFVVPSFASAAILVENDVSSGEISCGPSIPGNNICYFEDYTAIASGDPEYLYFNVVSILDPNVFAPGIGIVSIVNITAANCLISSGYFTTDIGVIEYPTNDVCNITSGDTIRVTYGGFSNSAGNGGTLLSNGAQNSTWFYLTDTAFDPPEQETRFISMEPVGGSTIATTTNEVSAVWFIGQEDPDNNYYYVYNLTRENDYGGQTSFFNSGNGVYLSANHGFNSFSTTTIDFSQIGTYTWRVTVYKDRSFFGSLFIGGKIEVMASTTQFYVGRPSFNSAVFDEIETSFSSLYASTTALLSVLCSPLNSNFSFVDCTKTFLVPPVSILEEGFSELLSRPPLGYIYRFYEILISEATSSLVVFHAIVPPTIMGAGSEITLDLNNSLDYILYSTTSVFTNSSASSTDTFYDITSYYWDLIVYLGLGFYILRRILGNRLIPSKIT